MTYTFPLPLLLLYQSTLVFMILLCVLTCEIKPRAMHRTEDSPVAAPAPAWQIIDPTVSRRGVQYVCRMAGQAHTSRSDTT